MKITIYGSGYVGLVTGACLADVGHHVLCADIDEDKIAALNEGRIPIHEPGLEALIAEARRFGRIAFTTDMDCAVAHAEVQIIAVGTPPDEDGSADLSHVLAVARTIGEKMTVPKIVVIKSTVPVGSGDRVEAEINRSLKQRGVSIEFAVLSNPEFLKEGAAIEDFMRPDRIIIGSRDARAIAVMRELYRPLSRNHNKIMVMDRRSAELTKYAANAMLATRISFMNEMAQIAEQLGADIEMVRLGIGADARIGHQFLYPGCGYGGSCFPKDVKALIRTAEEVGITPEILTAVERRNMRQKKLLFTKLHERFNGDLRGRVIALWGLAFKPGTDDMREAPSRALMEALWQAGARVRAHDPVAIETCRRIYGGHNDARDKLVLCDNPEQALNGADALVIVTEWKLYRTIDADDLKARLRQPLVFDGRNLFEPQAMACNGIEYYAIGRPVVQVAHQEDGDAGSCNIRSAPPS